MLQADQIERALVVTAHPDDVDFGAAGTIANLTDAGVEVTYCLVTDGQAGGFDETIARHEMARIRRAEQTEAAAIVGVSQLEFLGIMDGQVEYNIHLRKQLSRVIRQFRPTVVISQSPTIDLSSAYGSHPDHVATAQGAFAAVYPDSRNPFAFPDLKVSGYEPWAVDELWIMNGGGRQPDELAIVDITDQLDRKLQALRCHRSQFSDLDAMEQRVRAWFASNAVDGGLPEGSAAERYFVVNTR